MGNDAGDLERTANEVRASQETLAAVVAGLPAPLRQAWVMRYVKRIAPQEGARQLSIQRAEFEARLVQALRMCRVQLEAAGVDVLQRAAPLSETLAKLKLRGSSS